MKIKSAVAFIIFNRPRHTQETFAAIRRAQPPKLFVIADGPRAGHPTDVQRCRDARDVVAKIDWPCEVLYDYSELNLGCKLRVSSGLDWVFAHVESAIVLEDDCMPHMDFFPFCDELLDRYRFDERVWAITGNNFQDGHPRGGSSYYFSKYNHCWGWASWRRAWQNYRVDMPYWERWRQSTNWLNKHSDPVERKVFTELFDRVTLGEIDTWDYQWTACVWYHGGLTATPNVNLVSNIGFGPDATHTVSEGDLDGIPAEALGLLTHPKTVVQNKAADRYVFNRNFGGKDHPDRWRMRLKKRGAQLLRTPSWFARKIKKLLS
jgi:hypothetical protein